MFFRSTVIKVSHLPSGSVKTAFITVFRQVDMFGVAEIAEAISEEFRHLLMGLDHGQLLTLKDNASALRRMLPVGLSHGEAKGMIDVILLGRMVPDPAE